jgi:epoxyqueuosine reductase
VGQSGETITLTDLIKAEARRLGFALVGVTTPEPPPHAPVYEKWLALGRHGSMDYLADPEARSRRADPRRILPECSSILCLGIRYSAPESLTGEGLAVPREPQRPTGRIAAYAWGRDYHSALPERLRALVAFIEAEVGHPVPNRWYTDTGPVLERDLAQRAGLGWIGKNTCLISPKIGSYFFLAEILLGMELDPDPPFKSDHCGTCTRCIDACPTDCILPDRTIDARRCISYLTIENKDGIPADLRPKIGDWIFGCDICQMVCPWNERGEPASDPEFEARAGLPRPDLITEIALTPQEFNRRFKDSPVQRARRRGYRRNAAVALGNSSCAEAFPALQGAVQDEDALVREHADWAVERLRRRGEPQEHGGS